MDWPNKIRAVKGYQDILPGQIGTRTSKTNFFNCPLYAFPSGMMGFYAYNELFNRCEILDETIGLSKEERDLYEIGYRND